MDAIDIENVQSSFAKVAPIADAAAGIFYGRLFDIAPDVKPLFANTNLSKQGQKLMATLSVVVNGLKDLPSIVPAAQALAVRHNNYGVVDTHYAVVGDALIYTLDEGLGDAFTDEIKASWIKAYTLLSEVMMEAANQAKAA